MQAKNSKSYDEIRATIEGGIRAIDSHFFLEDTTFLDVVDAKRNDMLEQINRAQRNRESVNVELLNLRLSQYKTFLLAAAENWRDDPSVNTDMKSLIDPFIQHVTQQIESLQTELAGYQELLSVATDAPIAIVTTVNPQPLTTESTFIDQLRSSINRTGTVLPNTSKTRSQSALVKYDATTNIKDITVSRNESGQISSSTGNPTPQTLKEMLSILENMDPKGKKELKIEAQDEKTLRSVYDLAKELGHTVKLTESQQQTLRVTETPRPSGPVEQDGYR